MEFNSPPAYNEPPPANSQRPGSHGALIAGILTFATLGGAAGVFHWVTSGTAEQPSPIEETAPVESVAQEPPATSPTASASAPTSPKTLGEEPASTVRLIVRSLLSRDEWAVDSLLGEA